MRHAMLHSRLRLTFGASLELGLCMGEGAPPETQALVVPQDVHLLLGEAGPLEADGPSPERAAHRAAEAEPRAPGSLVVVAGTPLLMQAVVYDFARTPHARAADVFASLAASLEEGRQRHLARLAVQPVGTAHAGVEPRTFLRLLLLACSTAAELGTSVERVRVVLPSPAELARYEVLLRALVNGG